MLVKQLRKKKATKCFLWTVIAWWLLVHALLNCHYLQTEGVQGTGRTHTWVIGLFKDLLSPNWSGLFQQVESNNTTAKKKSLNGWFSIQLSLCWASQCFFHWTLCPDILNVIYALYATWTCVSVCMCVRVYFSLPHVFLANGLALSPAPWLACCPCVLSAGMRKPPCSPARDFLSACGLFFCFFFVFFCLLFLWMKLTPRCFFGTCPLLGFSFVWLRTRTWTSISPRV